MKEKVQKHTNCVDKIESKNESFWPKIDEDKRWLKAELVLNILGKQIGYFYAFKINCNVSMFEDLITEKRMLYNWL